MIKRENRLKKNKHFNYIYKHGCAVRGNKLNLIHIKTKFKTFKVGFSVSSKVGKAVVRNKVKRRLKAVISQLPHTSFPSTEAVCHDIDIEIQSLLKNACRYSDTAVSYINKRIQELENRKKRLNNLSIKSCLPFKLEVESLRLQFNNFDSFFQKLSNIQKNRFASTFIEKIMLSESGAEIIWKI